MADLGEQTKRDVVEQLCWDSRVDAAHVLVEVTDGVVTLTGNVQTYEARRAAEQAAWMADGVLSVDNRLLVHQVEDSDEPEDAAIADEIRVALKRDVEIKPGHVRVMVRDGLVWLEGSVETEWKKDLAGEFALRQRGVIEVHNDIVVESRTTAMR